MTETINHDSKQWFVLNFIKSLGKTSPQKEIEDFNKNGQRLELFAPMICPAQIIDGEVKYKNRLLTYFYVFVKGTLDDVKELCANPNNNLSLMLDRSSNKRYGIISDDEMENFKIIARIHTNTIPFYNIEDVDLQEGDIVEIMNGDYAGLKGTFIPKARSNKGNLVISVTAALGTILWDVDAKYVRIIEFAKNTRRQYDILDAFIPKLFPILRKFHKQQMLTNKEKTLLSVFNSRMGIVAPQNPKVEAKLLATLMCVQTIIGDIDAYRSSARRFEKRKHAVTNQWTAALIHLMLAVAHNDIETLKNTYPTISEPSDNLTKIQTQLIEEYKFHLCI